MNDKKGKILILSGPGGVGKDTILERILDKNPEFIESVSVTSRKMKEGEAEGADYCFKTEAEFKQMIDNDDLLEYTLFNGNYYGTSKEFVYKTLAQNKIIVFEIDYAGLKNLREKLEADILSIFIMPPSLEALRDRMHDRGRDNEKTIEERIKLAEVEISNKKEYDHVITNDNLDNAVNKVIDIVNKHKDVK